MPKKKPEEPIVITPGEPYRKCYDCIYWHAESERHTDGRTDFSSGSCDHNGYSKVPPLCTCAGWSDGNESILDKFEKSLP